MRAAVYDRYGPPEVLRIAEVPVPLPGDDEVLVRVHASAVGAVDSIARRGVPRQIRAYLGLRRPRIHVLGADFAGEVAAIGAKVTRFAVGEQASGTIAPRFGAHAEYICVSENGALAPKPAGLSHAEAAALVDGTALSFLRDKAKLHAGQSILVNGASGSVGTAAVQHARAFGATVTAVCSGANEALVRSLGAEEVIDYTKEDFTRTGQTYDVIFDAVGTSSFSRCRNAQPRRHLFDRRLIPADPAADAVDEGLREPAGDGGVHRPAARPREAQRPALRHRTRHGGEDGPGGRHHLPAAADRRRAPVRRRRTQARQRPCHPDQRGLATGRSGGSSTRGPAVGHDR